MSTIKRFLARLFSSTPLRRHPPHLNKISQSARKTARFRPFMSKIGLTIGCQYCCVCLMTGYRSVSSAASSIAAMTASGLVWWTMWPLPAMGRKMLWLMAL
jgi:hypothetical protein